ncbi:hypothetical protein, partial [Paraburkholderia aspalathi]|uniref:hypothetical protein n=1 Tax=Paraburkholderia aspalathi TaxID=1324617 RepID=UPI0038BBB271
RFLCLSFFAAAKKVSAAPHRANANRPLTNQGKAKAPGTRTNKRPAGNQLKKTPPPKAKKQDQAQRRHPLLHAIPI